MVSLSNHRGEPFARRRRKDGSERFVRVSRDFRYCCKDQWAGASANQRNSDDLESRAFIGAGDNLSLLVQKLGGGLALGSFTLIEGATTAGKSVLCQTLAHGAILDGHPVAFFTSEFSPAGLEKQMDSIGLAVTDHLKQGNFDINPLQDPNTGEDSGPLLGALALDLERMPRKYELIIVDAITQLVTETQGSSIVNFFSALRRLCSKGKTVVVTAHSYAFDAPMLVRVSDLCDNHLTLRTGKMRAKVLRFAEILKADNVALDRDNLISFEVEPKTGIKIIPYSQTKA